MKNIPIKIISINISTIIIIVRLFNRIKIILPRIDTNHIGLLDTLFGRWWLLVLMLKIILMINNLCLLGYRLTIIGSKVHAKVSSDNIQAVDEIILQTFVLVFLYIGLFLFLIVIKVLSMLLLLFGKSYRWWVDTLVVDFVCSVVVIGLGLGLFFLGWLLTLLFSLIILIIIMRTSIRLSFNILLMRFDQPFDIVIYIFLIILLVL